MNLDPDGATFWTGDIGTGRICRFNIATGALVSAFTATIVGGSMAGLAIVGEPTVSRPSWRRGSSSGTMVRRVRRTTRTTTTRRTRPAAAGGRGTTRPGARMSQAHRGQRRRRALRRLRPVPVLARGFIVEPDVLPYALIANRDEGAQKILLIRDAAKLCQSIRVGDYLEAEGEKQSEALFHADEVDHQAPALRAVSSSLDRSCRPV